MWGGVLGRDVGAMTLWEFAQAVKGHRLANGAKPEKRGVEVSDERLSAMGIEGF